MGRGDRLRIGLLQQNEIKAPLLNIGGKRIYTEDGIGTPEEDG